MTGDELDRKVKEMLGAYSGKSEVEDDANLQIALGMDSLDTADFIVELEREFDVLVPDEDWMSWTTVDDILKTMRRVKECR